MKPDKIISIIAVILTITLKIGYSDMIHEYASRNDIKQMQKLLEKNPAMVNLQGDNGVTPLHIAAARNYLKMAELLISAGAKVSAATGFRMNVTGITPLHSASSSPGNKDMVKLLLKHGAMVDAKDNYGFTPLHYAAPIDAEIVKVLVQSGAAINATTRFKDTPLHRAAAVNKESVKYLISKGADTKTRNKEGLTPRDIAHEQKMTEILKLLER